MLLMQPSAGAYCEKKKFMTLESGLDFPSTPEERGQLSDGEAATRRVSRPASTSHYLITLYYY